MAKKKKKPNSVKKAKKAEGNARKKSRAVKVKKVTAVTAVPAVAVKAPVIAEKPAAVEEATDPSVEPQIEPKQTEDVSAKKLVACMCMFVIFALLYNMLILPYADGKIAVSETETTTAETTEVTTAETTTVPETTAPTTTEPVTIKKELAAPVTKVYKPKTTRPPVVTAPPKKVLLSCPYVCQVPRYPTGCEAASATMMLKKYGYNVTLDTLVAAIPRENLYKVTFEDGSTRVYGPSIYQKFVGDPSMTYTSPTPGYGAFSPVVTGAMNSVINRRGGRHIAKNITGSSVNTLFKYLDEGHPVLVWATYNMKTPEFVNSWYIKTPTGDKYFEYPRGTHVMVLIGYDSSRVYINDPYNPGVKTFSISAFASKYALLGKQAIVVEEKQATEPETTVTETETETTEPESGTDITETTEVTETETETETTTETTTTEPTTEEAETT